MLDFQTNIIRSYCVIPIPEIFQQTMWMRAYGGLSPRRHIQYFPIGLLSVSVCQATVLGRVNWHDHSRKICSKPFMASSRIFREIPKDTRHVFRKSRWRKATGLYSNNRRIMSGYRTCPLRICKLRHCC